VAFGEGERERKAEIPWTRKGRDYWTVRRVVVVATVSLVSPHDSKATDYWTGAMLRKDSSSIPSILHHSRPQQLL
jgi:hypothetical protein